MTDVQIYVKTSCETCLLISELLVELRARKGVEIINQEETPIPGLEDAFLDADLERSFKAKIEAVPTVILNPDKANEVRLQGWVRHEWVEVFGEFAHEHLLTLSPDALPRPSILGDLNSYRPRLSLSASSRGG